MWSPKRNNSSTIFCCILHTYQDPEQTKLVDCGRTNIHGKHPTTIFTFPSTKQIFFKYKCKLSSPNYKSKKKRKPFVKVLENYRHKYMEIKL